MRKSSIFFLSLCALWGDFSLFVLLTPWRRLSSEQEVRGNFPSGGTDSSKILREVLHQVFFIVCIYFQTKTFSPASNHLQTCFRWFSVTFEESEVHDLTMSMLIGGTAMSSSLSCYSFSDHSWAGGRSMTAWAQRMWVKWSWLSFSPEDWGHLVVGKKELFGQLWIYSNYPHYSL